MNRDWQKEFEFRTPTAAATLPPAMVEETGWDILLALHSDQQGELALDKLASILSVPRSSMNRWLTNLARQHFVAPVKAFSGEIRAVLTRTGRDLLDHYLSAVNGLQPGSQH
jgi:response regulator of citrate/malate metabolism